MWGGSGCGCVSSAQQRCRMEATLRPLICSFSTAMLIMQSTSYLVCVRFGSGEAAHLRRHPQTSRAGGFEFHPCSFCVVFTYSNRALPMLHALLM